MNALRYITLMYFLGGFSSCTPKQITDADINNFISKYQNESFSRFIGISVLYRDRGLGDDILIISKQDGEYPPYIVSYSGNKQEVTNIDDTLLKKRHFENYLNDSQIKDLIKSFVQFDVQQLGVDSSGNVYVSPFYGEYSPLLLRINSTTYPKTIQKGYVYELYKGNWYIRR